MEPEHKNWKYSLKFNRKVICEGFKASREAALVMLLPTLSKKINDPDLERLNVKLFMTKRCRHKLIKERSIEIDNKLNELREQREQRDKLRCLEQETDGLENGPDNNRESMD